MNSIRTTLERAWEFLADPQPPHTLAEPKCRTLAESRPARPIDFLVIDVSYSMAATDYPPSRLDGAVKAATRFLERRSEISPEALVGIIAFSSAAHLSAPLSPVGKNFERLREALRRLTPSASTNIDAALRLAQEQIAELGRALTPRIILLTDGHSNKGTDPTIAAEEMKRGGIQLDIIGIGGSPEDVDEFVLRQMASALDGQPCYWFIRSVPDLVRKFEALALRAFH